jgi:hypothetical protein
VTYSLDFLYNLDTRTMTDPGAILGVGADPEKISEQVFFAVPQVIAPKPIHRGRGISPWVGGSAVSGDCDTRSLTCLLCLNNHDATQCSAIGTLPG